MCVGACVCVLVWAGSDRKEEKTCEAGSNRPVQIGARVNGYLNISLMHRPEPSNTVVTSKCTTLYKSSSRYSFD